LHFKIALACFLFLAACDDASLSPAASGPETPGLKAALNGKAIPIFDACLRFAAFRDRPNEAAILSQGFQPVAEAENTYALPGPTGLRVTFDTGTRHCVIATPNPSDAAALSDFGTAQANAANFNLYGRSNSGFPVYRNNEAQFEMKAQRVTSGARLFLGYYQKRV
jgi:hypothetical protein